MNCLTHFEIYGDEPSGLANFYGKVFGWEVEQMPGIAYWRINTGSLCADLKDRSKNGNRDLQAILEFIETDSFIIWAWDPGARSSGQARTAPPLTTQQEFAKTFKKWADAGAPCPTE